MRGAILRALFVPLRVKYYDAFVSGLKRIEYRPYGARWNERTCKVGRPVLISRGYGVKARMMGTVERFEKSQVPAVTAAWVEIYGKAIVDVACIKIANLRRVCDWCHGTGRRRHASDPGDASGRLCSLCEGSGEAND